MAPSWGKVELVLALADRPFDHLKQLLQILLPAQTALLGPESSSTKGTFFAYTMSRSLGGCRLKLWERSSLRRPLQDRRSHPENHLSRASRRST